MKPIFYKLFGLLAFCTLLFAGCSDDEEGNDAPMHLSPQTVNCPREGGEWVFTAAIPFDQMVNVSINQVPKFGHGGSAGNYENEPVYEDEDLRFEIGEGNQKIRVKVFENKTGEKRLFQFTFRRIDYYEYVSIRQE